MIAQLVFFPTPIVYAQSELPPERIRNINEIKKVFGPASVEAIMVAQCESRLEARVTGDSGESIGLFQIHLPDHDVSKEDMLDYRKNIEYAKKIYDKSGWAPWSCRKVLKNPNPPMPT